MSSASRRTAIGIGGGSAAGKTSVAIALTRALGPNRTCLICEDDYYRCASTIEDFDPKLWNFDRPEAKDFDLLAEHLAALKAGEPCRKPIYDFATHRRRAETAALNPAPFIIVEGHLHLGAARVRRLIDFAVFIDAGEDVRLARRMERDVRERARRADDVVRQFLEQVRPMHSQYILQQREGADQVLFSDGPHPPAALATQIVLSMAARRLLNP